MKHSIDWQDKAFSFFQNQECEFFPCHTVKRPEEFNCLFCYCPLYERKDCGGAFTLLANGSKDCSSCLLPHRKGNYGLIIEHLHRSKTQASTQTIPDKRSLVKEYAIENFKSGLNCTECVFDALQRSGALQVPPETIAMCVGFGGGIGLSGYTCGALSGAVMAIGTVHGRHNPKSADPAIRGEEIGQKYYRRYNKLVQDFEQAAGGILCRDITGAYDWHSRERLICCLKLIGETAAIAYDNLMIPQEEAFVLPYGENMGGLT